MTVGSNTQLHERDYTGNANHSGIIARQTWIEMLRRGCTAGHSQRRAVTYWIYCDDSSSIKDKLEIVDVDVLYQQ
ncbi:hypothetical protein [Oryza sativa Japonica Group]|jgi:hypothetical protein|uniref:Uncharacterized protein P0025D05.27 n=1 Tax=Oryza sativa subsp. japonica TaxID=39947 RepID=Q5NBK9_ORYSJ|nr:hypothetical protein [Oryza sativa Japonica Group]